MTAKVSAVVSVKEVVISGGTTVNAGQMYVHNDTNGVIVPTVSQTASAFATAIGASGVKTIDLPARVGAFADTGKPIFEVT